MDQIPERLAYTVKEAAAALGVSEWSVRQEISSGRIESIRIGMRVLIPRRSLESLVGETSGEDRDTETDADSKSEQSQLPEN